jgi:transposase InsO family protein
MDRGERATRVGVAEDLPDGVEDSLPIKVTDASLWIEARRLCEEKLKRLPTNEDMVDFAQSRAGKFVRHLFPFDDVESSARKHWVYLAGCYTRKATVIFASDPSKAPERVRALHIITDERGNRGITTIQACANNRSYADQVLAEARLAIEQFRARYEQLARVLKSAPLASAVGHVARASKALSRGVKSKKL